MDTHERSIGMRRITVTGALILGLGLFVTQVFAADFRITNNAHGPLKVDCTTRNITDTVSHGMSADFPCTGTFFVQRVGGGNPEHTIPFDCQSGQVKHTTVTSGSIQDELSLAHACVSAASG